MSKIIGIDLGTTNSAVAVLEGTESKSIANGRKPHNSICSFIQKRSKSSLVTLPNSSYKSRYHHLYQMGTSEKVSANGKVHLLKSQLWSFQYLKEVTWKITLVAWRKQLSQLLLTSTMRNVKQLKTLSQIAGLEVERIVNETTATALATVWIRLIKKKNLGIRPWWWYIRRIYPWIGWWIVFDVLATLGITSSVVTTLIASTTWLRIQEENGIDLSTDKMALQRLKDAAEKAKDLSGVTSTQIESTVHHCRTTGPLHLEMTLTRAKFDDLTRDLERTKTSSSSPFDAGLSLSDIDEVILVGGSTRIPAVVEAPKLKLVKNQTNQWTLTVSCYGCCDPRVGRDHWWRERRCPSWHAFHCRGIETTGGVFTKLIDTQHYNSNF